VIEAVSDNLDFASVIGNRVCHERATSRDSEYGSLIVRTLFRASAALLMTTVIAAAQAPVAAPESASESAPPARGAAAVRKPAAIRPAAVATRPLAALEITQIVGIRQVDPTTYEIDAKTQTGAAVNLRMNVFVMQDLGRQLGTYGK
jgi:hypothetical protein